MTQLNAAYVLSIFQAVATGTANGSYAIVQADAPEVAALVKQKYIKVSKKLHNADGNVGATLVDGALEADLRVDFEIPDFPQPQAAPVAPVVEELDPAAPVAQEQPQIAPVAETAAAPAPDFAEVIDAPFGVADLAVDPVPPAEFNPMTQAAPVVQPVAEAAPAPVAPAVDVALVQPAPLATYADAGAEVAAPVVVVDGVQTIGDTGYEVAEVVHTRNGDVDIDVGVPFVTKLSKKAVKQQTSGLAHHPFDDIAAYKIKHPSSAPSFHIADRAVKDMSNSVRRANDRYEKENSPVTFRANPAGDEDPKGKGVRVFALFVKEAPEQRRAKKDEAAATEQAE